jgi:hypothetical protein
MTNNEKLNNLATGLNNAVTDGELHLSAELLEGEVDVLAVTVQDREEFPIYVTVDDSQILCICNLWLEQEVNPDKRTDLLDAMLTMNIPMPLSSFSKVGNQYMIFGALGNRSSLDEVIAEIDMLSENTLTAVDELAEFLVNQE